MGSGRRLAPFPRPALRRAPAAACGKGLKVLGQLELPHLPGAPPVRPVCALTFVWGREGSCGTTQESAGLSVMHFKLLVLSVAVSILLLLSQEKAGRNSVAQQRWSPPPPREPQPTTHSVF